MGKKGEKEIPGLTDSTVPRRLGPKRASKIRKLFNLSKEDDVRQYVVRRPLPEKEGKKARVAKKREDHADYMKLLAQRMKEAKERKAERKRSNSRSKGDSMRESTSKK